ncbi:MAG: hypothetical protein HQK89_13250 [Nitrospirae bacterium]|nr:hypothetical protein [Nitrospirota bacterium]
MSANPSFNPWPGLTAYTELDKDVFFGRKREIQELLRLIEDDTLTTLFGRSGLGKTSILRAGIIPGLLESSFFPVLMRIDYSDLSPHPVDQVKAVVLKAAKDAEVDLDNLPEKMDGLTLWEFFHSVEFWSKRKDPLEPVLIFDQFEEVFTLGRGLAQAGAFLEQLADLAENRIPTALGERARQSNERLSFTDKGRTPKIVLSLREDYVSRLDSLSSLLPSIMLNRFDLQPLNVERAVEVVLGAGKSWVTEDVARYIVKVVGGGGAYTQTDASAPVSRAEEIEPAYLSVMCHEIYERMVVLGREKIDSELVAQEQGDILEGLYNRSFEGLSPQTRAIVEDRLLSPAGFRISVPLADMEDVPSGEIETLENRRLLRIENRFGTRQVELSHDLLTRIVRNNRDSRREREARDSATRQRKELRRKLIRAQIAAVSLSLLFLGIIVYYYGWIRPYTAYYKNFSRRFGSTYGSIYPYGRLSEAATKHRSLSLKIIRKGWFGKVQEMSAVDSLGNLTPNNKIGTLFTSSGAASCSTEKECQWEFIYDKKDRIVYEVSRDRFGRMVRGFVYSPHNEASVNESKGMFVGPDGYPQPQLTSGAEYADITYDTNGYEIKQMFTDRQGEAAPGPDDAFGRRFEYDTLGRKVKVISLDAKEQPMNDNVGNAIAWDKYDKEDNIIEERALDKEGKPILINEGFAIVKLKYDQWGNLIEGSFFDAHDKPLLNEKMGGVHIVKPRYDDRGNETGASFYGLKEDPVEGHFNNDSTNFHEEKMTYDGKNRLLSLSLFDIIGRKLTNQEGWHKVLYTYDDKGFISETSYFDAEGHKTPGGIPQGEVRE